MIDASTYLEKYKILCKEPFIFCPHNQCVTLEETKESATLRKVVIENLPNKTIVLDLDKYSNLNTGKSLRSILESEKGIFKCCDYLIITIVENRINLIFVEMKSNLPKPSEVIKQFKGGYAFFAYSHAIVEQFYTDEVIEISNFVFKYVVVTNKTSNKRTTKLDKYSNKSYTPANYLTRSVNNNNNSENIYFGRLL